MVEMKINSFFKHVSLIVFEIQLERKSEKKTICCSFHQEFSGHNKKHRIMYVQVCKFVWCLKRNIYSIGCTGCGQHHKNYSNLPFPLTKIISFEWMKIYCLYYIQSIAFRYLNILMIFQNERCENNEIHIRSIISINFLHIFIVSASTVQNSISHRLKDLSI